MKLLRGDEREQKEIGGKKKSVESAKGGKGD